VWILLVVLAVLDVFVILGAAKGLSLILSQPLTSRSGLGIIVVTAFYLLLIAAPVAAAVVIYRRQPWSRWLGFFVIVGLAALSLFQSDTTQYANEAQRAGGTFARHVLIPLLLAWWAYASAFSSKAKRYFKKEPSNAA
jgi:hypothetical protein